MYLVVFQTSCDTEYSYAINGLRFEGGRKSRWQVLCHQKGTLGRDLANKNQTNRPAQQWVLRAQQCKGQGIPPSCIARVCKSKSRCVNQLHTHMLICLYEIVGCWGSSPSMVPLTSSLYDCSTPISHHILHPGPQCLIVLFVWRSHLSLNNPTIMRRLLGWQ